MAEIPAIEDVTLRLMPIFSNLVFLWAASRFLEADEGERAFLAVFVAIFTSPVYHLCMGFPKACFWSVYKYHAVDFWTAVLFIPLIALMFVRFNDKNVERCLIWITVIVVGIIVTADSTFVGHVIIGAASIGIVAVYLVWHRRVHGYWPKYDMIQVTLGVCFCLFGVCFFIVQDWWPPYYGYTHSYWHAFVAIGAGFFAGIRKQYPDQNQEEKEKEKSLALQLSIVANNLLGRVAPFTIPSWKKQQHVIPQRAPPATQREEPQREEGSFLGFAPIGHKFSPS